MLRKWMWLGGLLLLAGCSFPRVETPPALPPQATQEASPTQPAAPTAKPVTAAPTSLPSEATPAAFAPPPPGTPMRWLDGAVVVYVPGGPFVMGDDGAADRPQREVELSPFWIYKTEVTNAQYERCVAAGGCSPPAGAAYWDAYGDPYRQEHPVVGVTWAQAQAYCDWAQAALPTEAQWEKAARGPDARPYPWGAERPTCERLNFGDCAQDTVRASAYEAGKSYYEAYDLAGNVQEWVADWYAGDYYASAPAVNPPGPERGEERVIRGSAFGFAAEALETARRYHARPYDFRRDLGFRCVIRGEGTLVLSPPVCRTSGVAEDWGPDECEPPYLTPVFDACDNGLAVWAFSLDGNLNTTYDAAFSPSVNCTFLSPENLFYCQAAPRLETALRFCSHCTRPLRDENGACLPFDCLGPLSVQDPETCECVLDLGGDGGPPPVDAGTESAPTDEAGPDVGDLLDALEGFTPQEASDCSGVTCPNGWGLTLGCDCVQLMQPVCPVSMYWDPSAGQCRFYPLVFDESLQLWPGSPDLWQGVEVDCPAGTTWEAASGCCQPPPDTRWPCTGFLAPSGLCLGTASVCVDAPVIFPDCQLPTPTPQACENPTQYKTQSACEANGCKWQAYVSSFGGYCTYP